MTQRFGAAADQRHDLSPFGLGTTGAVAPDRSRAIVACAGVSLLLYALIVTILRRLGTAEPSFAGEVLPWVERLSRESIERVHTTTSVGFLALLCGLFAVYGRALWLLRRNASERVEAIVFGAGAAFLLLQVSSPVMLSTDVFAYAMYGRIFAIYEGDPYVKLEGGLPDDPFLPLSYFLPWPTWYGPAWTAASGLVALVGGERVGLVVLAFRLLAIAGALACGGLIWACLRRRWPERAAQGMVFFLWNPLVVLEAGLSGHNDAVMAALLVGGIWLWLRGHRLLPIVAFTLSAMIKFVTGLVLPLLVLLILRQLGTRGERLRFAGAAGAAAAITAGVFFLAVGGGVRLPVAQSAAAAYFYDNNIYQIVFPALRVWLGEDPESARVPVHFYTWWGETRRATVLQGGPDEDARDVEQVKAGTKLLVTAPLDRRWVKVYNPASRREGYVLEPGLEKVERPESANGDPRVARLEPNPATQPIAAQANGIIRAATWLLFGAFYLLAAWRVRDERSLLVWAAAVFLAGYWLVATEIWPWYVTWSLALAALVPTSGVARLAAILSCTVLTLYVTIGFERSAQSWLFAYRSLPAFVLPLLIFGAWLTFERMARVHRAPTERAHRSSEASEAAA